MTTLDQLPWPEQKKIAAWTRCATYLDWDPVDWRLDRHRYLIYRRDYAKQSEYGWEIDHIVALAAGGADSLDNVCALHWRKNRQLGAEMGRAPNALRGLMALGEYELQRRNNVFADRPPVLPVKPRRGMFGRS